MDSPTPDPNATPPFLPTRAVPPKLARQPSSRRGVLLVVLALLSLLVWIPHFRHAPSPPPTGWTPPRNEPFRPNRFPPGLARPQPRLQPAPRRTPEVVSGPRAAAPEFSKPGGIYPESLSVELITKDAAAKIRYTVDGSDPTEGSPQYAGAISISSTTLLKAKSFQPGLAPSPTVSKTYTLLDASLGDFTSNLPLVVIDAFGQQITKEAHVPVSLRIIDAGEKRSSLTAPANFDGRCEIKLRGFSSLRLPKHSFSVKTQDDSGATVKVSVLGLPEDSDWVLYAPYSDKTLMRDVLAYELSNKMGRWAARTRFVELFVNRYGGKLAKRDYVGVYVFEEKIKRSKDRVNIQKLAPEDKAEPNITGGYIFKRDHTSPPMDGPFGGFVQNSPTSFGDEVGFNTDRGLHLFYVEPKETEMTAPQKAWLSQYMGQFERALYGPNFRSPAEGYAKYLDVDSFIDQFWIVELSKNVDGFRYSCYFYKDRGGKLHVQPIWDWNLSFGNANYHQGWMTENWYWPLIRENEVSWFRRLRQDPDFIQRLTDRWTELRRDIFSPEKILARVDELADELSEAQARNFQRWPLLGHPVNPNWYVGDSFEDEVNWMKAWIQERIAWIDSQFLPVPTLARASGANAGKVSMRAAAGEVCYTLDGTDPRASGGAVSPQARPYSDPVPLDPGTVVFARTHIGERWSGPAIAKVGATASAKK